MINFNSETNFRLADQDSIVQWIEKVIELEGFKTGEINYIFCDDPFLLKLNIEYLNHDTLTDIISFDYTLGKILQGDIFISVERVEENARDFKVPFKEELCRVMVHGILHYCGYKDKSKTERLKMREKENYYLSLLH